MHLCPVCCPFAVFCLIQLLRSELGPHACTTIPLQTEPSPGPPPRPPHGSASLFHCLTPPCLHSCSITPLSPLRTFANGPCPFSSFSSCLDDLPSSSLSSSQRFPLVSPPRLLFKNRNPLSWHLHLSFAFPPLHLSSPNTPCNFHTYFAGCLLHKRSQAHKDRVVCFV